MGAGRWVERDLVRPGRDDGEIVAVSVGDRTPGVVERAAVEARVDHLDVHVRQGRAADAVADVPADLEAARKTRVDAGVVDIRVDEVGDSEVGLTVPPLRVVWRVKRAPEDDSNLPPARHHHGVVACHVRSRERNCFAAGEGSIARGDIDPRDRCAARGIRHVTLDERAEHDGKVLVARVTRPDGYVDRTVERRRAAGRAIPPLHHHAE